MKKIISQVFILAVLILASHSTFAGEQPQSVQIEFSEDWQEYKTIDGLKIEYRMKLCTINGREQNVVLFRYSNLTNAVVSGSWKVQVYRDDVCVNCEQIASSENLRTLQLQPMEVIEADGTSTADQTMTIFGNFINLVPGMTDQQLTGFEFVDITIN